MPAPQLYLPSFMVGQLFENYKPIERQNDYLKYV